MLTRLLTSLIATVVLFCAGANAAEPAAVGDPDNSFYAFTFEGFFPGETKGGAKKNLNIYAVRRDGQWQGAVGTATNAGKPVWNTALMPSDLSGVTATKEGRLQGKMAVTLVPDPWVPADQKARVANLEVDITLTPGTPGKEVAKIGGTWKVTIDGDAKELEAARLESGRSGTVAGGTAVAGTVDWNDASLDLMLYDFMPGQAGQPHTRRKIISVGVREGKAISARLGQVDITHRPFDLQPIDMPEEIRFSGEQIAGRMTFSAETMDADPATFALELKGQRVAGFVAGIWTCRITLDTGKEETRTGFFRGNVGKGAWVDQTAKDDRPWFVAVPNWEPVQPGEHPRLFFRKKDLPEIKRRAATPEGQRVVARLKELLGGGEAMPTSLNPSRKAYSGDFKAVTGSYSITHAAGFGMLYQLTGDKKYADLGRKCVELAWEGQRNFDDRYSWVAPGGELRAGPSLGWYAIAYDLCYDGWDPEFRQTFAKKLQDYDDSQGGEWGKPTGITMRAMALAPRMGPGSNHFGAVVGGCGLAVLAIKGDPGTDAALLEKYDATLQRNLTRSFRGGFGDGGFYGTEGFGPSQVFTQGALLPYIQALRNAAGRDYVNGPRQHIRWLTMLRAMELVGPTARFPYRSNFPGSYGSGDLHTMRRGFSHGGHFCEGFGVIPEADKPALLWVYNNFVEPPKTPQIFDAVNAYPGRAILTLINWPFELKEQNPAERLPRIHRDSVYEYFVFRQRWQDAGDPLVTCQLAGVEQKPSGVMVWGFGTQSRLPNPPRGQVDAFTPGQDGSGWIVTPKGGLAVDYSGASGAPVVVVVAGVDEPKKESAGDKPNPKVKQQSVKVGATGMVVFTLVENGEHPAVAVEGSTLKVGKQTFAFDGKAWTFATFTPLAKQ